MARRPGVGPSRRAALRLALAAPALAAACRPEAAAAPSLVVPLAALPEGSRVRALAGDQPIELVRRGGEVRARSLWCTHMGCEVRWSEEQARYLCPCHGGVFDASGNVLAGPPPHPLRSVAVEVDGDRVRIPITVSVSSAAGER